MISNTLEELQILDTEYPPEKLKTIFQEIRNDKLKFVQHKRQEIIQRASQLRSKGLPFKDRMTQKDKTYLRLCDEYETENKKLIKDIPSRLYTWATDEDVFLIKKYGMKRFLELTQ